MRHLRCVACLEVLVESGSGFLIHLPFTQLRFSRPSPHLFTGWGPSISNLEPHTKLKCDRASNPLAAMLVFYLVEENDAEA